MFSALNFLGESFASFAPPAAFLLQSPMALSRLRLDSRLRFIGLKDIDTKKVVRCSSYVDNTESVKLEVLSIINDLKFKCILPSKPNGMSLPENLTGDVIQYRKEATEEVPSVSKGSSLIPPPAAIGTCQAPMWRLLRPKLQRHGGEAMQPLTRRSLLRPQRLRGYPKKKQPKMT